MSETDGIKMMGGFLKAANAINDVQKREIAAANARIAGLEKDVDWWRQVAGCAGRDIYDAVKQLEAAKIRIAQMQAAYDKLHGHWVEAERKAEATQARVASIERETLERCAEICETLNNENNINECKAGGMDMADSANYHRGARIELGKAWIAIRALAPAQAAETLAEKLLCTPDYKILYMELLYQVGKKHPGETRHETALRYLKRAEEPSSEDALAQAKGSG